MEIHKPSQSANLSLKCQAPSVRDLVSSMMRPMTRDVALSIGVAKAFHSNLCAVQLMSCAALKRLLIKSLVLTAV